MTDFCIALPVADLVTVPPQSVLMAEYNDGVDKVAYWTTQDLPEWPVTAYRVGAWDRTQEDGIGELQLGQTFDGGGNVVGVPTFPLHTDYVDFIRPLGNEAGRATGFLDSLRWQGQTEAKFLQDDERYEDTDSPFTLNLVRDSRGSESALYDAGVTYNTGDYARSAATTTWRSLQDGNVGNAQFGGSPWWELVNPFGWGWTCTAITLDPERDLLNRAVGIYSDPECTAFLGTSGQFEIGAGGVRFCVCPTALITSTREQVNWALLLGAGQEGYFNLLLDDEETTAQFWSDNQ